MIESLYKKFLSSTGICTDTRTIIPGNLFFALSGPNFNANSFADEAIAKGASYVIIDDFTFKKDERYLVADYSLMLLQELANYHRKQLSIPVIGITGSNGKTTTKELIHAVLSKKFRTVATQGNLNNHIGVPLTVLSIGSGTEIAIIEMGANKPGDIRELCSIAEPTHGIITNIGKAHIEGFGNFEGVLRTKTELYDHLIKNGGTAFINSANPVLMNMAKRFKSPVLYGSPGNFYQSKLVSADPYIIFGAEDGETVFTSLIGSYNFDNISTALCIGKYFGVDMNLANQTIAGYAPSNMRSQIIQKGTNTILLDAYNANPDSMKAALITLSQMKSDKKIVILGDMLELGDISVAEHEHIGNLTKNYRFDEVYFCGPLMAAAHACHPASKYFPDKTGLEKFMEGKTFENSVILIKASRGIKLETIAKLIN